MVLAAVRYAAFDLDRFLVPKELVLHLCALALAAPALLRARAPAPDPDDALLGLYLALSAAGALLAGDRWLAARALAITFSGAALFWAARGAAPETRRAVAAAAAAAAVLAAAASLAQAYGLECSLFSPHRAPGGTLGNRNFTAHLAAVLGPWLCVAALRGRRGGPALAGVFLLAAALVLTRSRAALLGAAAGAAALAWGLRRAGLLAQQGAPARLRALLAAGALGALAALALPNALRWRSGTPYLDTLTSVADYSEGSGRARLRQYKRSLRLAAAHPVLGAGAGNWSVAYPKHVREPDGSVDYATGRTINPWPSSDWVAVLSERGLPALAALLLLFASLGLRARRALDERGEQAWDACALGAALAAAAVVGCFDAFLLLPAPAFLFWGLAGALAPERAPSRSWEISPRAARRAALAAAALWSAAVLRSAGQLAAMSLYSRARTRTQLAWAARLDPDSPRLRAALEAAAR